MHDQCDCQDCKNKRTYRLEGIAIAESKINEKSRTVMGGLAIPKAKIKEALEAARAEVR